MTKIRVLHVLPWIASGGVERLRAAIVEQSSSAFEHRFFTFKSNGYNAERIRMAGAEITDARDDRLQSHRSFIDLARVVREFRPHIIHGAVFEGVILAATVGRALRVPVVLGEETSFAENRSPRGHALFRALSMLTHRTVAISPQVADKLKETTRVAPYKIQLIMNGVDPLTPADDATRVAARNTFGLPKDALILGTMARLVTDSNKRISDVITAMPEIVQKVPHAHLLVCGSGRDQPKLEALTEDLNLQRHVTFAGTVVPQEGFDAMDVFVHVAQREGFGLAVAEAAFCALPIITTGVGGIASIVLPDRSARIVPVGAPDRIAAAAVELLSDAALREEFGAAGRAYALDRFSSTRYVQDVEALYRTLIKERKVRL